MLISYTYIEQVRIHDSISHVRWAGALMEVRSLFGLNFTIKKTGDRRTDGRMDGETLIKTHVYVTKNGIISL